ncbi:hypothetical protein CONLIGDRAFT_679269 [Coniochaeta ligniaria NRRL 30616]|uniref:Uncharacterized protein n=1 Tax=Coniochaeta ligniaria NRRL 30616 TaxID=1408157 RepID=A0A1J7IS73_9PEZI|nr:hypothetical protein CONLIGDRAFT_679269 [Coniochaeta ligniaria NRRL 30616]
MSDYDEYSDDDDTRFDVILYEDEPSDRPPGAELKAPFEVRVKDLGGEQQPLRTIDEDVGDNALTVQCDMAQVVHGTMVEGGSPATLIVFQFVFLPRSNARRFKEATITITFSAGNVEKATPNNTWAMLRSSKEQKISHSVSPSLEAAFGPGKATMGYTWQLEESIEVEGYAKVEGLKRALGQSTSIGPKRTNTVIWTLRENNTKQIKSGIPSFVQTAVLLKREKTVREPLGAKFSADIVIRGEVDNHEWVKDKWKKAVKGMSGKRHKGEDVIFNPELNRGSVEDVDNLESVDLESYKQLVTIRQWFDGTGGAAEKDQMASDNPSKEPVIQSIRGPEMSTLEAGALRRESKERQGLVTPTAGVHNHDDQPYTVLARAEVEPDRQANDDRSRDLELSDLQEQLSLVRAEAQLVNRLIALVNEETRLVEKISTLRGP